MGKRSTGSPSRLIVPPFKTIVADPPWKFEDNLPGPGRGAAKHYACLSLEEIVDIILPYVPDHCRLFLWRVASMQQEALDLIAALGAVHKCEMVWLKKTSKRRKRHFGLGHHVRNEHETCLIAVRGKTERLSKSVRSTFTAKFCGHSGKPNRFYQLVEEFSPGPYLELFARRPRPGWTCVGDELEDQEDSRKETS